MRIPALYGPLGKILYPMLLGASCLSAQAEDGPEHPGELGLRVEQVFTGVSAERSLAQALERALGQLDQAVARQQIPCNSVTWRMVEISGRSGTPEGVNELSVKILASFARTAPDSVPRPGGLWDVQRGGADDNLTNFRLWLSSDGEQLSGHVIWPDGEQTPIGNGAFRDGRISFRVQRNGILQEYQGMLEGNVVTGRGAAGLATFPWQARRSQPESAVHPVELHGVWHFEHGALGEFDTLHLDPDMTFTLESRDVALGTSTTFGRWSHRDQEITLWAERRELDGKIDPRFEPSREILRVVGREPLRIGKEGREFQRRADSSSPP